VVFSTLPAQLRGWKSRHVGRCGLRPYGWIPSVIGSLPRGSVMSGVAGGVAAQAISRVCPCQAQLGFGISSAEPIYRHHQHRAAGGLHSLHYLFRVFPAQWHIELIPGSRAACFGDFLISNRGARRQNLQRFFERAARAEPVPASGWNILW
jgi:hypothetical protein